MRSAHLLLLCVLGAALFSSAICSKSGGPDDCCFTVFPRRVNKNLVKSYYLTDHRCHRSAVILVTNKGAHLCVDPNLAWVEGVMRVVDGRNL
ncbi:C-C motif chemokine 36.1 [Genypterus blacodes]|uniref:C-C motif chemokine 36.1 n=1 Tax=Genypterus blacodes TaxID=154954 RepID=UPI003F7759C6